MLVEIHEVSGRALKQLTPTLETA